jgi:hypothetical protein
MDRVSNQQACYALIPDLPPLLALNPAQWGRLRRWRRLRRRRRGLRPGWWRRRRLRPWRRRRLRPRRPRRPPRALALALPRPRPLALPLRAPQPLQEPEPRQAAAERQPREGGQEPLAQQVRGRSCWCACVAVFFCVCCSLPAPLPFWFGAPPRRGGSEGRSCLVWAWRVGLVGRSRPREDGLPLFRTGLRWRASGAPPPGLFWLWAVLGWCWWEPLPPGFLGGRTGGTWALGPVVGGGGGSPSPPPGRRTELHVSHTQQPREQAENPKYLSSVGIT